MLHDLANDDGNVALKWAVKDRGMETERKDAKNLLYSRRLLIMMMQHSIHCVYIKASRFYVNFNSYTKYSYTWLCFLWAQCI